MSIPAIERCSAQKGDRVCSLRKGHKGNHVSIKEVVRVVGKFLAEQERKTT